MNSLRNVVVVMCMFAIATAAIAETRIRFAVEYDPAIPPGIANIAFKEEIEKRSNGAIKVDFFGSGSLYKGQDLLQANLRGDVQMTTLVSSHWIGVSPKVAVFELPFAFADLEAFYRTIANRDFMKQAFSEVEAKGAKVIDVFVYDYAMVANVARPIIKPEDFKGMKLRAVGRTNARSLELLGGIATPINVTEASVALERRVIDGMNTTPDTFVTYKWDSIVRYGTESRLLVFFYPWTVNAKWWDSLQESERTLIQTTMADVLKKQHADVRKRSEESVAKMAANGVRIHRLTSAEEKAWRERTDVQWTEAEKQYGKELVDAFRKASAPSK